MLPKCREDLQVSYHIRKFTLLFIILWEKPSNVSIRKDFNVQLAVNAEFSLNRTFEAFIFEEILFSLAVDIEVL